MQKYDDIVVGSGISGLTMSLILALNGHRVMLLEKSPYIGGSLSRFYRDGVAFDTGFHFTGGLQPGGILHNMLSALGMQDLIQPVFLSEENAGVFILESENKRFEHPYGIENIKKKFKGYFPHETSGIDKYFDMVQSVCARTPSMNLHQQKLTPSNHEEDFITLEEVLKDLTQNPALKAILSGYTMCYGVKPQEISFANHSRMCSSFYESMACVDGGGEAFIKAFETKFKDIPVEVNCGKYIADLADICDNKVGRFVLNTGEEILADNCFFTIHPQEILKLLPREHISKAFVNRVSGFESSAGFFAVFAVLETDCQASPDSDPAITSLFPHTDINQMLDPANNGAQALVILKSMDRGRKNGWRGVHILEPAFAEQVSAWRDSRTGDRSQSYQDYKEAKVESIKEHIFSVLPEYKGKLEVLDAASMLTFRDYLNSPDGSAYGVKQKIGQYNLVGKLPLRNLYAAGQSAILPGIVGAMMSSFIVVRSVMGKEQYDRFLNL